MLITTHKQNSFSAMLANQWRAPSSNPISSLAASIGEHPVLAITDAVDLGAGIPTALNAVGGRGGAVLDTASGIMGAYHGFKAVYHLVNALNESDNGPTRAGKHEMTMALGEGLSAAGQICIASGVGPVSLGFLGLGLLVTNFATLSR